MLNRPITLLIAYRPYKQQHCNNLKRNTNVRYCDNLKPIGNKNKKSTHIAEKK